MIRPAQSPYTARMADADAPLEIERTYLLDRLPDLPAGAIELRIEQGYLPEPGDPAAGDRDANEALREGRLRRVRHPDGTVRCAHTIKRGSGLVRTEIEREISEKEFERAWPRTEPRRLRKRRFIVEDGGQWWEIDHFDDLNLVLAEIELADADAAIEIPGWLAPHIVREVTDEKQYRNYELALRLARER